LDYEKDKNMPKILKTDVTGSGNISLSSRIKIRDYDNKSGAYPTIHRLGDSDRKGNVSLNPFDDQSTLIFGKRIEDKFESSGVNNTTVLDPNKWLSSAGIKIRNEILRGKRGEKTLGKSLVFAGKESVRYLQTKEKIRNPTMRFELQQGPYNIDKAGLNIRKGEITDTLKVQISAAGSTWTTITTYTPETSIESFYTKEKIRQGIYKKSIKLSMQDFPDPGSNYYLRIAQDSISNAHVATWAIASIDIESANQSLTYGINNNLTDESGKRVYQSYISTPHTASELTGVGSIRRSISDGMLRIDKVEEIITPFNEKKLTLDLEKQFFNEGTDPAVYPGFELPAKNKTVFTYEMTPGVSTSIGYTNYASDITEDEDIRNNLMVYWNKDLKRWQKIGDGIRWGHFETVASGRSAETLQSWVLSSSNVAVGFGPQAHIVGSASNGTGSELLNISKKDMLLSTCRPVDNFSFPFGGTYHATSSFTIRAKDIGITKPFILEKCSLDFNISLVSLSGDSTNRFNSSNLKVSYWALAGTPGTTARLPYRIITPTFFILRQFNSKETQHERLHEWITAPGYSTSQLYLSSSIINVGNVSRELVTYGQPVFITTGSSANAPDGNSSNWANFDFVQDVLDSGVERDALFIDETSTYGFPPEISGNFEVNFNSRLTPSYDDSIPFVVNAGNPATTYAGNYKFGKKSIGRSNTIDSTNRSIVNGTGPKVQGDSDLIAFPGIPTTAPSKIAFTAGNSIDLDSPYIILPEDELILGWQYPLVADPYPSSALKMHYMTINANKSTFLKLIGSLVSNGKEFHETTNQNINSQNIYEHIVNKEKVIDKWQINRKEEHTGSFLDNHFRNNTKNRTARIGLTSFSAASGDAAETGSFNRYVKTEDQKRIFKDSKGTTGAYFNNSSYGTMKTGGLKISPKYYYNYKHYGYHSDLFKQSIDTKYADINTTLSNDEKISTLSPINTIFVKGEVVDTPDAKVYKRKDIDEFLDDFLFQSSNLSLFATASIPFIDDNSPKNRNYVSASFVAV
jgi:hypothetical protein